MNKQGLYDQAELMLREYLGLHKLRNTNERLVILRYVVNSTGRFTAYQLTDWVKPHYISRATVYNTLEILEKAHVVHCLHVQHSGRLMEYEFSLGEQSAMQIVCTRCGRIARVHDKSAEIAIHMKKYPNFIMQHYSIYVFGECKTCKRLLSKQ